MSNNDNNHNVMYVDQCEGSVWNANPSHYKYNGPDVDHGGRKCTQCVANVNKFCSEPTFAIRSSCFCAVNNTQDCRCQDSMTMGGTIVMVVIPVALFILAVILVVVKVYRMNEPTDDKAPNDSVIDTRNARPGNIAFAGQSGLRDYDINGLIYQ